jgi:hypothetical protein
VSGVWQTITSWVEEHVGQSVTMSMNAAEEDGDTCAIVAASGTLAYAAGEWVAVEPPSGRHLGCTIGDASVLLFEGSVEDVERHGQELFVAMTAATLALSPIR